MAQKRNDHSDDSTMSYYFWATVKVLIIYFSVLFFTWISALMPPNQVYHSFSRKKCIDPCCNSVCRTENIVVYMPQQWPFQGSWNSLQPWGRNQRVYSLKSSRRSLSKYLLKKTGKWFQCCEMQWLPKNANFVRITLVCYTTATISIFFFFLLKCNFMYLLPCKCH